MTLVPNYKTIVNDFKAAVQTRLEEKLAKGKDGGDEYAALNARAAELRALAAAEENNNDNQAAAAENNAGAEEEKKDAPAEERKAESIEDIIADIGQRRPWMDNLATLNKQAEGFVKQRAGLMRIFSELEGREALFESILEVFGGEPEILAAVLL